METVRFSILIVDDDADDREFIDEAFIQIGHENEVKKFINGDYLLHYLNEIETDQYPSLIVLDNTLPQLQATDLISLLKSDSRFQQIPIAVYSTSISPAKKSELMEKGAQACFEKANSMQEAIEMVTALRSMATAVNPTA